MKLLDRKEYYATIAPHLTDFMHKRHPLYLCWFLLYLPAIFLCVFFIVADTTPWPLKLALSICSGFLLGGLMMLGHEIAHKSVVKSKHLIWPLATLCLMQHGMTATVWDRWHNRLHHVHTQVPFEDPDSWGYEKLYQYSRYFRFIFRLSPGSGKHFSFFFLFFYFTWQAFMATFMHPNVLVRVKDKIIHRLFFVGVYVAWIAAVIHLGGYNVLWLLVIPLACSNFTIMMYIATNHFISRINAMDGPNDTLLNTLSVTVPQWMNFLHFNISYHVEHHLFPYVSSHYYPDIQKIVKAMYPEKYACLPLHVALHKVYATPRFYKDTKTLIHPETRRTVPTLQ